MKFFLFFISFLALNQCSKTNDNTHFIEGKAPDVINGLRVYYNSLDDNGRTIVIDTSIVIDEKFYFDKKETYKQEEVRFLTLDGSKGNFILLVDEKPMRITLKKDSLFNSDVHDSPANETLKNFKEKQADYANTARQFRIERANALKNNNPNLGNQITKQWLEAESSYKKYAENLITTNSTSIVAPMILGEMLNSKMMDAIEARSFYNQFNPVVQNSQMALRIDSFLKKAESVAIGAKAPYFEGNDPDGNVIKLPEVLGKVTLIDFWASWCGPCRRENPNVVKAYEKYHNKGFNIISVSLDRPNGEQAWKDAIKKDNMNWNHISRLQYFGPIAKQYNVSGIPATFLLDENGIIIDTNLRGAQLHQKLEELLGAS